MSLDVLSFRSKVNALMAKKNLVDDNNVAVRRFALDFEAHAFTAHAEFGDGERMLDLLSDGSNLFDGSNFDRNFKLNLNDFVKAELKSNKTFNKTIKILTTNKSKGVGIGELVLPLLVSNWVRNNESDGMVNGGIREVKNGEGASLKPVKTGLTNKGLVDELNAKYFDGLVLGKKKHHATIMSKAGLNSPVYSTYFKELWPTANIDHLMKLLENMGNDLAKFHSVLGRFILKEYQKIDGWKSIVLIHPETLDVVNIANVDDDSCFENLSFKVRLSRQKDTQAVPDGYAVVQLADIKNLDNDDKDVIVG